VAYLRQVHGGTVLEARAGGLAGDGDALVTDVPSLGLMGVSADCPIILAADRGGTAIGMAHASWRGTVRLIAERLVAELVARYGVSPSDVVACIGPSAGPDRYEVGQDVVDAARAGIGPRADGFFIRRQGRTYFDLWSANRDQLMAAGVPPDSVHVAGICTIARNDLFPSYRVEGARAGRFAAVISKA
jgi:hypothetical protein